MVKKLDIFFEEIKRERRRRLNVFDAMNEGPKKIECFLKKSGDWYEKRFGFEEKNRDGKLCKLFFFPDENRK